MELLDYLFIIIRLTVAVILGGLIGIEREGTNHAAGLRTHILVCLGAAGITALSYALVKDAFYTTDITRFGAQVVSGIGFLGAGCIMVNRNKVKGLTTAAGLWTTACVGLATGLGYYIISVTITLLVLLAMLALRPLGNKLHKKGAKKEQVLYITVKNRESFQTITACLAEHECSVVNISTREEDCFKLTLTKVTEETLNALICSLMEHKDIKNVERT